MSNTIDARTQYATAHEEHYKSRNLRKALELYRLLLSTHPNAPEAAYAKSQIENIVNTVVPKQDYFKAQMALASAHLSDRTEGSE